MDEHLADAKRRVPKANCTTAILYVHEMPHMPQATLLRALLSHMIQVVLAWKAGRKDSVSEQMSVILQALNRSGWSGRLLYKRSVREWEDIEFPPCAFNKNQGSLLQQQGMSAGTGVREATRNDVNKKQATRNEVSRPIELTRHDEMRELWKAAGTAVRPGGGAPFCKDGSRLAAVIQAAAGRGNKAYHSGFTLPVKQRQAKESSHRAVPTTNVSRQSSGNLVMTPAGAVSRHRSSAEVPMISLSGRQSPGHQSPISRQPSSARQSLTARRMSCPSVLYEVSPASLSPQLAY